MTGGATCFLHGASEHHRDGRCILCWSRRGLLLPGVDLRAAPPDWWALHEAVTWGNRVFTATCPQHGLGEHLTSTGQCRSCRRDEPLRLRPP